MDKQEQLHQDIELTVKDAGASISLAPVIVPMESSVDAEPEKGAEIPQSKKLSAVELAARRKADDKAFYADYLQRQFKVRIRFGLITTFVLIAFFGGVWQLLASSERARDALVQLPVVFGTACLGEKDLATYELSQFPNTDPGKNSKTVDARLSIIDRAIADLDARGRTSIFGRLGAEVLLMKNDRRAEGFAYGQYLINKYPNLPSNLFVRAKADFDQGHFPDAVTEYEQCLELLQRLPERDGKAWAPELPKAAWVCIDQGKMSEAEHFINAYEKFGGSELRVAALRAQIPISMVESLDLQDLESTKYWSSELAAQTKQLLARSLNIATGQRQEGSFATPVSDSPGVANEDLQFEISMQTKDLAAARRIADSSRIYNYFWAPAQAQIALHDRDPQAALAALDSTKRHNSARLCLLRSQAYIQMGLWTKAADAAERGLAEYRSTESATGRFFLPLHLSKGHSLLGMKRYKEALAECDFVIAMNTHLIEAHLLKLHCLEALQKPEQLALEQQALEAELKTFAEGDRPGATP